MEVLNANEAVLSNFEVLNFLREERKEQFTQGGGKKTNKKGGSAVAATVILESMTALEATPAKNQSKEKVQQFMREMKEFNLTQSEKLMILNHCPESAVEIHLFVEESEERLSEEQADQILNIVKTVLKGEEEQEQEQEVTEQAS
jgi:DNA-directed RNA polymerase subunit F